MEKEMKVNEELRKWVQRKRLETLRNLVEKKTKEELDELKKKKQRENLKKIREVKYNQWWEKLKQEEELKKERLEKVGFATKRSSLHTILKRRFQTTVSD